MLLTQMAKALGARVFTTVSTEEKAALSRDAGADVVVNYQTNDFVAEIIGRDGLLFEFFEGAVEFSLGGREDRGRSAAFRCLSDASVNQRKHA